MSHPVLLALPYLNMNGPIEFGPWWLGPTEQFGGPWLSADFERLSRRFLASFTSASGDRIEGGALLARRMSGADGEPPERSELAALEAAIGFSTIHQNPYWSPDGRHDAWRVATSDNADLWAQPINVSEGWIALGRGGRVETMSGGLNLNDDHFVISAPLELHRPFGVTLDPELVEAVYEVLTAGTNSASDHAGQIQVAVRWLLRSWRNTPSITWEDRVVYVKVATEALSGTDSTEKSAELLEAIFAGAANQPGEGLGTDRLLWDPSAASRSRSWTTMSGKAKTAVVSAFAHWYWALADARNALVHGEDGASLTYDVSGSP
jgi:hypothetical protein